MIHELEAFVSQLSLKDVENILLKQDQVNCPLTNIFQGGVYIRQIEIPADTLIIGKRHRFKTCNFLASGKISIYMGKDRPVAKLEGPYLFESPEFAKKMFYCHTDTVFMNIHPTELTDLDEIEKHFIIEEEEYQQLIDNKETQYELDSNSSNR